ncbi:helix-turn-helix domain-containing protein [Marinilactibacillus psychrotolerans]|uniref:helix-turn-helix domain-containing protein n=1 Tax=Marinilactibacillus psychrotolerans TaxID=191770 RepID=UPI003884567C
MNIGENLKRIRKENKLTLEQLAEALNNKSNGEMNFNKGRISKWENGKEEPRLSSVKLIADFYGINIDSLYSSESSKLSIISIYNQLEKPRQQKVYSYAESLLEEQNKVVELPNRKTPLLGDVAANPTELAYGDPVYDEEVTSNVPSGADGALTIQGDSMEDLFRNGDICFFHRQPDVENGEIAIVEIDGSGVTCKKVIKENGCIILRSLNDKYKDRKIEKESVRIIGKVLV